jgi:general stress protein YciG
METEQDNDPQTPSPPPPSGIKRRGFASMSREKRRLIASAGGKVAHSLGRAHVFTSEEAQAAGRKGGRTVSQDAEHMARIGRAGGTKRWTTARAAAATNKEDPAAVQPEAV